MQKPFINAHADLSSRGEANFCLNFPLLPYFVYVLSEGYGETVQAHMSLQYEPSLHSSQNIFLLISLNKCFGCSKEPSHQDGSLEHPQHMFWFWLRNKKIIFNYRLLSGGLNVAVYGFPGKKGLERMIYLW